MHYKMNIYELKKPVGDVRANVSVVFEDCLIVKGIKIKESNEGNLYVDMPKQTFSESYTTSRVIASPKHEFGREFYGNILETYINGKSEYSGEINGSEDMEYFIDVSGVHQGKCIAVANLTLENAFVINGFRIMSGENGVFVSNPAVKQGNKYVDICYAASPEFRAEINENILSLYDASLSKPEQDKAASIKKQIKDCTSNMEFCRVGMDKLYAQMIESDSVELDDIHTRNMGTLAFGLYECRDKIKELNNELTMLRNSQSKLHKR